MRRIILAIPALMIACAWPLQAAGAGPDDALNARLAAESLKRSADHMIVTPDAPLRAARLVALGLSTLSLAPGDAHTHRTFANVIYPSQGLRPETRKALETYLSVHGDDHVAAIRWLHLVTSDMHTAEARMAYLGKVSAGEPNPPALRSEALARLGQILIGRGRPEQAAKAFADALGLDPGNATALAGRLDLLGEPAQHDRVSALLADLKATAGGAATANELADLLQAVGLHRQAVALYGHTHALVNLPGSTSSARHLAAVRLYNAMLDARQALKTIEMLSPLLRTFKTSIDLRSLLAEAYRATYNQPKADEQISVIESVYESSLTVGRVSVTMAGELAMFYLVAKPDAEKALNFARQVAAKTPADDIFAQRILGGAEIASGKPELVRAGRNRLGKIIDRDLYAAVLLAKYYFASDNRDAAKATIRTAAKLPRSGPAFRKLLALADKHTISIGTVPGSRRIAALVSSMPFESLSMRLVPERFIRVTVELVSKSASGPIRLPPGEALALRLTLESISRTPVPIGKRGLLVPVVSLEVTVDGAGDKRRFNDLPLCVWPAPRYLRPGQKVQDVVRLDVSRLGRLLARTPLTELTLTVNPVVSPIKPFGRIISALPRLKIQPLKIVRTDLLGRFDRKTPAEWPKRYQYALGMIVRDMKQGDLARRMRAARQVASLLVLARGIERGAMAAPTPLKDHVTKPVLLTMLREVMKDAGYAVRAEMIAAMGDVSLDRRIMPLLAPTTKDPHPLVRFRLAELLVSSGPASGRDALAALARDTDPLVRRMAQSAGAAGPVPIRR